MAGNGRDGWNGWDGTSLRRNFSFLFNRLSARHKGESPGTDKPGDSPRSGIKQGLVWKREP
jgi:hypothetical protein